MFRRNWTMIPRVTRMFFILIPFVLLTTAAIMPDRVTPEGDCKWGLNAFTPIPGYANAAQSNGTCDHFDPNETSLAMFLFYIHYVEANIWQPNNPNSATQRAIF